MTKDARGARAAAWLRRHAEWFWVPGLMLAVTLLLYRTLWWPPPGKPPQWFGWDCLETYWPDLSYTARSLRQGVWPLWNPYDRGGFPFYADPQPGLYYPVNWLFVVPGAILGGMPAWTIQVKALLHHALMGSLLYAFLRTRGLPRIASLLGGVAVILSVPFIIHKASAQLWPMVWAPLVWICIDRLVVGARAPGWWRRSAALAAAIFVSGASGPPPGFFYILLMGLAYGGLRLVQALVDARREGGDRLREESVAQARALAVAAAIAVVLLLVVVVPGLGMADESATRGAARDLKYALNTALPVGPALRGLVAPWAGLVDAYWGLAVVVLAVVGLAARPRADRGAPVLFAAVAFVAMLLVFGGATPVLPWLVRHVPGFGLFREPNRYKLVVVIAIAVVAAHGVAALLDEDRARRRRALVALAAAVGALAVALLLLRGVATKAPRPGEPGVALSFAMLLSAGALLAGLGLVRDRRAHVALVAAVALLLGWDTSRFGAGFLGNREAPVDDQEDRRALAGLGDVAREWRVYDEYVMEQRAGMRLGVRDFRGYPSGDPLDDLRYSEVRARLAKNPELAAAFNIGWVLHGPHHRNGGSKNFIAQPPDKTAPTRFRRLDEHRFEVVDPAPLVAWYGAALLVPGRGQAIDALVAEERASGLRTRAVVESPDVPRAVAATVAELGALAEPPAPVAGKLLEYGVNAIRVAVEAPARGLVVLNEKMSPGWQVTVDGKPAVPLRANVMLRAVVVPPGAHTLVWSYHPPRYALFLALWLAGIASIVAAALSAFRARRPRPGLLARDVLAEGAAA